MNNTKFNQFNSFITNVFINSESNRVKERQYAEKDLCDLHFCRKVLENIQLTHLKKAYQYISADDLKKLVLGLNNIFINSKEPYLQFKFREIDFFQESLKEKIKYYQPTKNLNVFASIIIRSISNEKQSTMNAVLNTINFHENLSINDLLYICHNYNIPYLPSINGMGNNNIFEGYYNIIELDDKKLQDLLYLRTSKNKLSHYIVDIYDKMSAIKVIIDGVPDNELNELFLKSNIDWLTVQKNQNFIRDDEKKRYRLECKYNNYNNFINYVNSIFNTNFKVDNKNLFSY